MDLRRLEASGDRAGQLRELLRRGLNGEARALALELIRGGAAWSVVDAEGVAWTICYQEGPDWLYARREEDRWCRVYGVNVRGVWDRRRARLFACDVAGQVLPLFEAAFPEDRRPRDTVEVARRHAYGQASDEELAEAHEASWEAAEAASRVEEGASPSAWGAAAGARASAWASAWVAEMDAAVGAWGAASVAAEAKEAMGAASGAVGARLAFIQATVEPLFARWSLGEVPEYTE